MTQNSPTLNFQLFPRDRSETHRAATMLELMFDLAAVIAIAASAAGLHHAVASGHIVEGIIGFLTSFFMVYGAWMNYTWVASTYDDDSVWFRANSMFIMVGALVLAAGIPAAFAGEIIILALVGFIIMRVGLLMFWIAAARSDTKYKATAKTYAIGIILLQIYWTTLILTIPAGTYVALLGLVIGYVAELALPVIADRKCGFSWHRHHLIERFGLLTIIVLGECFLAVVMAFGEATHGDHISWDIIAIGVLASVITFLMWALYFSEEQHIHKEKTSHVFLWAYGHYIIFAAAAAAGAGFAVMIEFATHHASISSQTAALSVAIPVAIYVLAIWMIRDRHWLRLTGHLLTPIAAVLVVLAAFSSFQPLLLIAIILAGLLLVRRQFIIKETP